MSASEERRTNRNQRHIAGEMRGAGLVEPRPAKSPAERLEGQRERARLLLASLESTQRTLAALVEDGLDPSEARGALMNTAGNLVAVLAVLDELRRNQPRGAP